MVRRLPSQEACGQPRRPSPVLVSELALPIDPMLWLVEAARRGSFRATSSGPRGAVGWILRAMRRALGLSRRLSALLLVVAICAGCSARPQVTMPSESAPPRAVLLTYLRLLEARNCDAAHSLAVESFTTGNGELCGDVHVRSFALQGSPAHPAVGEVVYATRLVTEGSHDDSIPAGALTWFYGLTEQRDGSWRLSSGGSGP
jgi:hypothetical protein